MATLAAALCCAGACVSAGGATDNAAHNDRDVITQQEIDASNANDGYAVVRALRPHWLLPAPMGSTTQVVQVYVDGGKVGSAGVLQRYNVRSIREIRWLNGVDATTRFGTGNGAGAILVFLKR